VNDNDRLVCTGLWGGGNSTYIIGSGTNVDATYIHEVWGNQKIDLYNKITKNSIPVIRIDSVYCKGLDTTYYELKY
jgi:hypothetical protein